MAHILDLKHARWRSRSKGTAAIHAILRTVAAEHTLALRAATKAASPRRSVSEVRAMYVSSAAEDQR